MQQIDKRAGTAPADDDDDNDKSFAQMRHKRGDRIAREHATVGKSLTILQRAAPEKESTMDDYLTKLERQADALLAKLDRAINDNTGDDDDDDDLLEGSEAGADAYDQESGTWDTSDDDDDDEDDDGIEKATDKEIFFDDRHRNMGPTPVDEEHPAHPYQIETTPATRAARPHKFDRLTEHIMDRDQCSRSEAMSTARREHPDVYRSYQDFHAASPTNEQATRRAIGQRYVIGKRAATTYEDLVAQEMRKGVTMEIAGQRVMQQHGSAALRNRALGKRSDPARITKALDARIDEVVNASGCERTEALRWLRKRGELFW
jgi:hypothetical protein